MKKGFTLAEVLITLGIIGIIAALTIPNLMESYKDKVLVTSLKKAFNDLKTAVYKSQSDADGIDIMDANKNKEFLEKYLDTTEAVAMEYSTSTKITPLGTKYVAPDGATSVAVTTTCNAMHSDADCSLSKCANTSSGYTICKNKNAFTIDSNGPDLPNQIGKDLFFVSFLVPSGKTGFGRKTNEPDQENKCTADSTSTSVYTASCLYYVVKNGWKLPF